jgi:sugar phosphate isomerase/epimerase
MFGVSPAFVFSLYGTNFSVTDFCGALSRIKRLGYTAFQPEIYFSAALPEWLREAGSLQRMAEDLGLVPTQFVAHFMLEWFSRPERVGPDLGLDELKRVVDIAHAFPACRVVTVPAGQFDVDWGSCTVDPGAWQDIRRRLIEKIRRYLGVVSGAGIKLAFEIMPFSVIGGIRRFLDICDQIGSPDLGLNFDTGHAWACRELVPWLPFELQGRIFGTHLGDNRSTENVKMPLGQGTIPWAPLIRNLRAAGYAGSLDIEIGCSAGEVEQHYRQGLEHLQELVDTSKGDRA